jgi:hypothetical protein
MVRKVRVLWRKRFRAMRSAKGKTFLRQESGSG